MNIETYHQTASAICIGFALVLVVLNFLVISKPGLYLTLLISLVGEAVLAAILLMPWFSLIMVLVFLGHFVCYVVHLGKPNINEDAARYAKPNWQTNTPAPPHTLELMDDALNHANVIVPGYTFRMDARPGYHRADRVEERRRTTGAQKMIES